MSENVGNFFASAKRVTNLSTLGNGTAPTTLETILKSNEVVLLIRSGMHQLSIYATVIKLLSAP